MGTTGAFYTERTSGSSDSANFVGMSPAANCCQPTILDLNNPNCFQWMNSNFNSTPCDYFRTGPLGTSKSDWDITWGMLQQNSHYM
jgi:hypothetical protein